VFVCACWRRTVVAGAVRVVCRRQPARFNRTPTAVQVNASFEAMRLKDDLLKGIYAYGTPARVPSSSQQPCPQWAPSAKWLCCHCVRAGFEKPSAIQARAIKPMIRENMLRGSPLRARAHRSPMAGNQRC